MKHEPELVSVDPRCQYSMLMFPLSPSHARGMVSDAQFLPNRPRYSQRNAGETNAGDFPLDSGLPGAAVSSVTRRVSCGGQVHTGTQSLKYFNYVRTS